MSQCLFRRESGPRHSNLTVANFATVRFFFAPCEMLATVSPFKAMRYVNGRHGLVNSIPLSGASFTTNSQQMVAGVSVLGSCFKVLERVWSTTLQVLVGERLFQVSGIGLTTNKLIRPDDLGTSVKLWRFFYLFQQSSVDYTFNAP